MKLTICQIGKLFLLLTAFFLHLDSQQLVGVLCTSEKVAIERLNASGADTTGKLTTVTVMRQEQTTSTANVTAVSAVIIDKVCSKNNKNSYSTNFSNNNSGKHFEICAEEQSQQQENKEATLTFEEPQTIFEYTVTTTKATRNAKQDHLLHAPTIGRPIGGALMSTVETAGLKLFRADVTDARNPQNVVQSQRKLITTTPATEQAAVTAGTAIVAARKLGNFRQPSFGQNASDVDATTERQNLARMPYNVQQQRVQQSQRSENASKQQQVQPQAQQQHRRVQIHRPRQQFDTIRQPLATKATIKTHTTTKLAARQTSAHLSTEMKKLQMFSTKISQQQLPKQEQQRRQKSTNKENEYPVRRKQTAQQRKRKPLEVKQGQQQKQQQHTVQQQHLFTLMPLPTQSRQPQQNTMEWRQQVGEQLQQDAQHVPENQPLRQQQHSAERQHHVGVIIPTRILDVLHVRQGFYNFLDFFHVNLQNVSVDFIRENGKC